MTQIRIAAALAAAVAGVALTVALGNWQMQRAEQKMALHAELEAAQQGAPLDLNAVALKTVAGRLPVRVRAHGRFVHELSVWLDNRNLDGAAGFWLVTPLRLDDGAVVIVNRGWAPQDPADRTRLPPVGRPQDRVEIEGLAVAQAPRVLELGAAPTAGPLPAVWQNLDYAIFEQASGLAVARLTIQQTSALDDGLVRRWPRPDAGVDRHHGYAVQWYALAALIVVLTVYYGARAWRGRPASRKTA